MYIPFRRILLFLLVCLLPVSAMAQGLGRAGENLGDVYLQQASWIVGGKVKTVQGDPVRGATVMVTPLIAADARVLTTNAQGEFGTEYLLNSTRVDEFSAILTVKKKGFQTAHAFIDYARSAKNFEIPLTLRDPERDPALLSPADLISGLVPKLKQLGPARRTFDEKREGLHAGSRGFRRPAQVASEPCRFLRESWKIIPRASGAGPCWASLSWTGTTGTTPITLWQKV